MSLQYFTPISGLIGGSLIGLSAATLLLFNGDILGASGLMSSFVVAPVKTLSDPSQQWKLSFLAAFALTARLWVSLVDPDALKDHRLGYDDSSVPIVSPFGFLVGGFLVGFGTRLGNGCTTGHGICGLARLSRRSAVAVLTFMTTGIISASACSVTCPFHPYLRDSFASVGKYLPNKTTITIGTVIASIAAGAALPGVLRKSPSNATKAEQDEYTNNRSKIVPSIFSAVFFAIGLVTSKMTVSSKIYGFLNVKGILMGTGTWDPTLAFVMVGGLFVSFLSYQLVKGFNVFKVRIPFFLIYLDMPNHFDPTTPSLSLQHNKALECPITQKKDGGHFSVPTNNVIDNNLFVGEAIFGLGWGIAGLCPGPAMFLAVAGYQNVLFRWWPSFFVGSFLAEKLKTIRIRKISPNKP